MTKPIRNLQVARAALDPQVRLVTEVRLADSGSFDNSNDDPIGSNDRFRLGAEATYPLLNHGSTIDQLHIAQENLIAADADFSDAAPDYRRCDHRHVF